MAIAINDLPRSRMLDGKAMSSVRGGVFNPVGAFRAFSPASANGVINFYQQINNFFIADQLNLTVQNVDITNLAPNSNISVDLDAISKNGKDIQL